jgi:hypothetical protein
MQGQLFTQDFLHRGIRETPPYEALTSETLAAFRVALAKIHEGLNADSTINEAQTEQLVIDKVLVELGLGRRSSASGQCFPVRGARKYRMRCCSPTRRPSRRRWQKRATTSATVTALPSSKPSAGCVRWIVAMPATAYDPGAPSSQMLRYLSRVDVISDRAVKWGILTNGAVWRLYWQDARSRAEEFFEIDACRRTGQFPACSRSFDAPEPDHALRLFFLMFHRAAFLPQSWDSAIEPFTPMRRTRRASTKRRCRRISVRACLATFFRNWPRRWRKGDLHARTATTRCRQGGSASNTRASYLEEVREAALILLYRLLFLFYAEDRGLLPVRDERYAAYSVRRLREARAR